MLQRWLRPWSVYPQSQVPPSPAATADVFRQNLGKLLKYLMILYQKVRHCQSFLRRVLLLNHRRQKMTWVTVIFLGSTPGIQGRSWLFFEDCLFLFLFIFSNWSIIALQCCVGLCCRTPSISQVCRVLCCALSCSVVSFATPWAVCSPPGSSVHGDSPGKNTGVGCHALLQGIFPTQGSNPGLSHCRQILYQLSHQGSPKNTYIPPCQSHPSRSSQSTELRSLCCVAAPL